MTTIGRRTFDEAAQRAFGDCSGDVNPVHMDAVAARRTVFGAPVVHGVHGLLWALDCLFARSTGPRALAALDVKFQSALPVGTTVDCELRKDSATDFDLGVVSAGATVSRISGSWREPASDPAPVPRSSGASSCQERTFDDAAQAAGVCDLFLDIPAATALFPALTGRLPDVQLAAILATTRIVGMQCPGLHSIFTGLRLAFDGPAGEPQLAWRVTEADRRMSRVTLTVDAPGITGVLRAFVRPAPRAQPTLAEVARSVTPGEFEGRRVLIIGGSRGLGEVAAKIVAAGSGRVCVTFNTGEADAERLCQELRADGHEASALQFDVMSGSLPSLPWPPTDFYFFATPFIGAGQHGVWSAGKFDTLARCYATGFGRLLLQLLERSADPLKVFYPSTIFLDQAAPQFLEYCAAKAAGEELCRQFAGRIPRLRIEAPRLPRMTTDQTAALLASPADDPVAVLVPALRRLADR